MSTKQIANIEHELHTLQRSVRRWRMTTWAVLIGVSLFAASAATITEFDHIVVNRLDVRGSDGFPVVSISGSEIGGRIDLYNQKGTNLLRLSSGSSGGDLALWDDAGTNVAGLWSSPQGGAFSLWNTQGKELSQFKSGALTLSGSQASLHVQNEFGSSVAVVASDPQGHGRFQIADKNGTVVSEMLMLRDSGGAVIVNTSNGKKMGLLAATNDGGQLNLLNRHGVPVFIASAQVRNGGGAMSVINARGIPVLIFKSDDQHRGILEVLDEDGNGARRIRPIRGYSP